MRPVMACSLKLSDVDLGRYVDKRVTTAWKRKEPDAAILRGVLPEFLKNFVVSENTNTMHAMSGLSVNQGKRHVDVLARPLSSDRMPKASMTTLNYLSFSSRAATLVFFWFRGFIALHLL
jgi:hypothetical protein